MKAWWVCQASNSRAIKGTHNFKSQMTGGSKRKCRKMGACFSLYICSQNSVHSRHRRLASKAENTHRLHCSRQTNTYLSLRAACLEMHSLFCQQCAVRVCAPCSWLPCGIIFLLSDAKSASPSFVDATTASFSHPPWNMYTQATDQCTKGALASRLHLMSNLIYPCAEVEEVSLL